MSFALGVFLCTTKPSAANTYVFGTAPGATINSGGPVSVDASVTFITALNQITIRITNLEPAVNPVQAISAVDFHLQGLTASALNPTLYSYQGEIGNLHTFLFWQYFSNDGLTYNSTGGNVTNQWSIYTNYVGPGSSRGAQIQGGIQLTALNAGGNQTQLILGPPNGTLGGYTGNSGLIADNPLLRTQANSYIEYVIHFSPGSGVTSATVVDRARMSWSAQFNANTELELTPEPGTYGPVAVVLGLAVWRRHRSHGGRPSRP